MEALQTPALLLDINKFDKNCARMLNHLKQQNVRLRAHAKTCKSIDALKRCFGRTPPAITVSTLREAEYFAANGIRDICYAVGITPQKMARAWRLREQGVKLGIILDSVDMARSFADFAAGRGQTFDVLLEVDCDGHRGGLAPDDPELLECARIVGAQNLAGVLTHAGSAHHVANPGPQTFARLASQEAEAARKAAARLRGAGFEAAVVSVGSTPTALYGEDFAGITETRPGAFMFNDCTMLALNACAAGDIALSVLCTVIGQNKSGAILVDAGWSALSSDRGVDFEEFGYGLVCDAGGRLIPGLKVAALNQEHGMLENRSGAAIAPGARLRILPQHSCAAAHNFDKFHVLRGTRLVAEWERVRGW